VAVRAATVAAALERLVSDHPGLRRHLLTDGGPGIELRDHVNVFVNDDDIRTLDGTATSVAAEDTITIVPSIAGG
jgi:molybdopterin synthase sulfur carrier subunit